MDKNILGLAQLARGHNKRVSGGNGQSPELYLGDDRTVEVGHQSMNVFFPIAFYGLPNRGPPLEKGVRGIFKLLYPLHTLRSC